VTDLARRLGTGDAVVLGLGSMIGAGIFVAPAPAARAAGSGLLIALAVAALVAYCNAASSARLAARYPSSGGTYVYGRERLGPLWGYLAGWAFVTGKTASCAAMALTVGTYAWPAHAGPVAVVAALTLTAVNYVGISRSAALTKVIVAVVLAVLGVSVVVALASGSPSASRLGGEFHPGGTLQAAGLLFFAFAGYARIATLGEEVRDPERTIPRAVLLALVLALAVYAVVIGTCLLLLGPGGVGAAPAPLTAAVRVAGASWLVPVVRVGAAVGACGSLLALILGVSRTTLAMARDRHLPGSLAAVHPRYQVPHRAEVAVGIVVSALAASVDVRSAIGFSSFGVLAYYAIANASAWTLAGGPARAVPAVGLGGCVLLAGSLPASSVASGALVLAVGVALYALRRPKSGQ
jgi:APA family basic amino acid/polyamine antiporter